MGWKWASYALLRFKRSEVEGGISLNGLFNPRSTQDRLGTSFEIRNLEAWLRSGALWTEGQRTNSPQGGLRGCNPSSGPMSSLPIPPRHKCMAPSEIPITTGDPQMATS